MIRYNNPEGKVWDVVPGAFTWKTPPVSGKWNDYTKSSYITISDTSGGMVEISYTRTPRVRDMVEAMELYAISPGVDLHWAEWAYKHAVTDRTNAGSTNIWVQPCKSRHDGWGNSFMIAVQSDGEKVGRICSKDYATVKAFYPEILLGLLWKADDITKEDKE